MMSKKQVVKEKQVNDFLEYAWNKWKLGCWDELTALPRERIKGHSSEATLLVLVMAGLLQKGDFERAKSYFKEALSLECDEELFKNIIYSGIYNTLGKIAFLINDESKAQSYFENSLYCIESEKSSIDDLHARQINEIINFNYLPKALDNIQKYKEIETVNKKKHMEIIDLEIDILRNRINALQKQIFQFKLNKIIIPSSFNENKLRKKEEDNKYYKGLHGLDKKLEIYVNYNNGYFVELGANDGINQSNTYYFEKQRGWQGLLIEPVLHNFLKCKSNRSPGNIYACAACVSFDYDQPAVKLIYSNLMTTACGLESDLADPTEHARSGEVHLQPGDGIVEFYAPAKTLTYLLDQAKSPTIIDLLSLDVEGAEIEVLKGIDHSRYRFRFLLIESQNPLMLSEYLEKYKYCLVDKLSHHDYLYAACDAGNK